MDLFNNEIIAYKLYEHQQTPLVIDMLKIGLKNRNHPEGVQSSIRTKERHTPFKSSLRGTIYQVACRVEGTVGTIQLSNLPLQFKVRGAPVGQI